MRKRILSLILSGLMIVSLFPTAMAAEEPEMPVDEAVETVPEAPADQAPAEPAPAEPAPAEPEAAAVLDPMELDIPVTISEDTKVTVKQPGGSMDTAYTVEFTADSDDLTIFPIVKDAFTVEATSEEYNALKITVPAYYAITADDNTALSGDRYCGTIPHL